jgi:hypothetical protein
LVNLPASSRIVAIRVSSHRTINGNLHRTLAIGIDGLRGGGINVGFMATPRSFVSFGVCFGYGQSVQVRPIRASDACTIVQVEGVVNKLVGIAWILCNRVAMIAGGGGTRNAGKTSGFVM